MKAIIIASLMTTMVQAQSLSEVSIKNFNFNYKSPSGEGVAEVFSYKKNSQTQQKVFVEKHDKDLYFQYEGFENGEFAFKDAPAMIIDADQMNLTKFNLVLSQNVNLNFSDAEFISGVDVQKIQSLSLGCSRNQNAHEFYEQFIQGCIENMDFKVGNVSSNSEKALGVKTVDVKIKAGVLNFSADVKAQISGKVRGKGNASYDESSKTLTLKISEVKFGILDVSGMVFDELKKLESDTIKVKKPFVYITMK